MGGEDHCHVTTGQIKARNSTEGLSFSFSNKAKYHNLCWLENDSQSVENEGDFVCVFFSFFSPSYSSVPAVHLITKVYITVVRTRERVCVCVRETERESTCVCGLEVGWGLGV